MKLGCLAELAMITLAALAGVKGISLWWAMAAAFVAGSFSISNGPGFDIVMTANREGKPGVFPRMLASHIIPRMALCGGIYLASRSLA